MIGVVTTSYPRAPDDMAGSFVRERVRQLVHGGHQVEVIAAGDPSAPSLSDDGAVVWRVPFAVPGVPPLFYAGGAPEALEQGGAGAVMAALRFTAGLSAALRHRSARWSRVESHWLVPCALLTAALVRCPHQAFAHSGDVSLLERLPGGDVLGRWLWRRGIDIHFVSADLRRRFADRCGMDLTGRGDHLHVQPMEPSRDLFTKASATDRTRARRRLGVVGPLVFSAGRLVPIKGFDLLVRAVGRLAPGERRPLRLVIAGEGPERQALQRLASSRGVDLCLLGERPAREVALWMAAADLYVQPSRKLSNGRSEGAPVAVAEARAVGTPVIQAGSGVRETGLVPGDDVVALTAALRRQLGGAA